MQFPSLTAMSFNLLYTHGSDPATQSEAGTWPQRRPLMRRVIEKHAPDVIGFQEVEAEQMVDLKADLSDYDFNAGPRNGTDRSPLWAKLGAPPLLAASTYALMQREKTARIAGAVGAALGVLPIVLAMAQKGAKGKAIENGGYCPIFWKKARWTMKNEGTFWISHVPHQRDSVMFGAWLPRICNWAELRENSTGERLQIFNVHLDWWLLARARGGRYLAQQMNRQWKGEPQLLLGDFNAPRQSATWNALLEGATEGDNLPLYDAWSNAGEQIGPKKTFHGGDGRAQFPGRIDHVLIRPAANIQKVVSETLHEGPVYPSDHFPLVARIHP